MAARGAATVLVRKSFRFTSPIVEGRRTTRSPCNIWETCGGGEGDVAREDVAMTNVVAAVTPANPVPMALPGEELVAQSHDKTLTVTNYRVRYQAGSGGNTRYASIMHDAVSSCSMTSTSQPMLLVLGLIAMGIGLVLMDEEGLLMTLLLVSATFVVMFFATRKAEIVISSNGGERIVFPVSSSRRSELLALLFAVEGAKLVGGRGSIKRVVPS
jgi:hypothetical protein